MNNKTKTKFNVIIIFAIIVLAISTIPKTMQEDTYYMIKVGEYIIQNGMQVIKDQMEPFSWLDNMKYTYPHWLLDIVFYLIYNIYNFTGVYILVLIIGIIIYMLMYYLNIKIGKNNIISAIIAITSIYLMQGFITARAQIITYISCILEILFIERFLETKKKKYFVGLVIIPIILANCHAALFPIYFVIYLPYIAEYIISYLTKQEIYKRLIRKKEIKINKIKNKYIKIENKMHENKKIRIANKINREEKKARQLYNKLNTVKEKTEENKQKIIIKKNANIKWLIGIFIICIFTGLLTPINDIPYTYMIKSLIGNTMSFIAEHQPVELINVIPTLTIMLIIVGLLFSNKIKIRLQDLFMLFGMTILALISYKQFPIFLICTMTIINKLSLQIVPQKIKATILEKINKLLSVKVLIYIILIIIVIALLQYKNISKQNYVDKNEYPIEASTWLKNNLDVKNIKLFNDFNYGSYLLFKDIPVFIDGRADVYDPVFNGKEQDSFLDYMLAASLQIWYEDVFKKYEITHIITKTESNFNIFLQRNIQYKILYDDGTFAIYKRLENI